MIQAEGIHNCQVLPKRHVGVIISKTKVHFEKQSYAHYLSCLTSQRSNKPRAMKLVLLLVCYLACVFFSSMTASECTQKKMCKLLRENNKPRGKQEATKQKSIVSKAIEQEDRFDYERHLSIREKQICNSDEGFHLHVCIKSHQTMH